MAHTPLALFSVPCVYRAAVHRLHLTDVLGHVAQLRLAETGIDSLQHRAKAGCTTKPGRVKLVDVFSAHVKAFFNLPLGQRLAKGVGSDKTQIGTRQAGSPWPVKPALCTGNEVAAKSSKKMKVTPRITNCGACGADGSMNWGKSAPKNSNASGLPAPPRGLRPTTSLHAHVGGRAAVVRR